MKPGNHRKPHSRVLIFVFSSFSLLLLSSFLPHTFHWYQYSWKGVDMFSDIRKKQQDALRTTTTDTILLTRKEVVNKDVHYYPFRSYLQPNRIIDYSIDSITAGLPGLTRKLLRLKKGEKKKVRIAFMGDSMIEGDLITKDIRKALQQQFGGSGIGFIPVTSVTATEQSTVQLSFSDDWQEVNFHNAGKDRSDLFISGHTFTSSGNSWVAAVDKTVTDSVDVQLLYGNGSADVVYDNTTKHITGNSSFNVTSLKQDKAIRAMVNNGQLPVYGLSFESETGVIVDNLSFRGTSGIELRKFDSTILQNINKERPYDLVVLEYGLNVLDDNRDTVNFKWYNQQLTEGIRKIKRCFPQAEILVLSSGDRAFRIQDVYQTTASVPNLVRTQAAIAYNNKVAFFNLYQSMGGENSMVEWVTGSPRLAYRDYTHPNEQGATRIAGFITESLLNEVKKQNP